VKPSKSEILDIDDTFCAARSDQQLAFWNAHHDERGFASMHIYHVENGTPVVAILLSRALVIRSTKVFRLYQRCGNVRGARPYDEI
jgi:hypothetical protein